MSKNIDQRKQGIEQLQQKIFHSVDFTSKEVEDIYMRISQWDDFTLLKEINFFSKHPAGDFDDYFVICVLELSRRHEHNSSCLELVVDLAHDYAITRYDDNEIANDDYNPYKEKATQEILKARENLTESDKEKLAHLFKEHGINDDNLFLKDIDTSKIQGFFYPKDKGFLYVVEDDSTGKIKIGMSEQPQRRIKSIQSTSGIKGRDFVSREIYHPAKLELQAHENFKDRRHIGEWFFIDFDEAVSFVRNITDNQVPYTKEDAELFSLVIEYNSNCVCNSISIMMTGIHAKANGYSLN